MNFDVFKKKLIGINNISGHEGNQQTSFEEKNTRRSLNSITKEVILLHKQAHILAVVF